MVSTPPGYRFNNLTGRNAMTPLTAVLRAPRKCRREIGANQMDAAENKKLLDRLSRIEGQVRGLRKMMEEQRCCEDVLTQLLAARSGLEQASLLILDRHLEDCVLSDTSVDEATLGQLRDTLKLWSRHTSHVS